MLERMKARINFHLNNGLTNVEFVMEHDFIRGWQVYEERVLNYVSSDFLNIPESIKRTIEWINNTIENNDTRRKEATWWPVRNMIEGKLMLISLARANVSTADNAYKTGEPILLYETTLNRRYDMSYISLELLQKGASRQKEYFDYLMEAFDISEAALKRLLDIGETFVENGSFDGSEYLSAKNLYIKGCKGVNYRLFLFKERIILKPMKYIKRRMTKFFDANETMIMAYESLKSDMDIVTNLIQSTNSSYWRNVHHLVNKAMDYELDLANNKTQLAQLATSVTMAEDIRQLKIQFSALRSRAQEVSDNWRQMSAAYQQMWVTMVSETSTQPFYEMIHNDSTQVLAKDIPHAFYRIFASLLGINEVALREKGPEDLQFLMNADFHIVNLTQKLADIQENFSRLENSCKISYILADKDEKFLQRFDELQVSLETFLSQNVMNQQFYR